MSGLDASIEIFLRVKPVKKPSPRFEFDPAEGTVEFNLPKEIAQGLVNNQKEHYSFKFNGVFGMEAKQDEIFERVARKVILGALDGYNGTIFAYGQTGSGKTFTITGGPERYVDRGIIPRTLSFIFSELAKRSDQSYSVHVSYLEIYNEQGYDLLDPDHETKTLEELPRVTLQEDEENRIHLRNLSAHQATNEEEALNLLFLGDTCRAVSATPMNMASSRSHCMFTVSIEGRRSGEATVRRSKLNIVDLAGSERVSKTNVGGQTLTEAKYINLSLHYLEQVIIALQERAQGKARPHIPYRNSMMTSVLRDSLGGNCKTVMIATLNSMQEHLDESISTCRFAQRVAMVNNSLLLNEESDPRIIIKRMKQEIRELKDEVRMLRGEEEERGPITESEKENLKKQIIQYVQDGELAFNFGGQMMMINAALELFREVAREMAQGGGGGGGAISVRQKGDAPSGKDEKAGIVTTIGGGGAGGGADPEQLRKLRMQVQQRDNEINILVAMLKKKEVSTVESCTQAGAEGGFSESYNSVSGAAVPSYGSRDATPIARRTAWGETSATSSPTIRAGSGSPMAPGTPGSMGSSTGSSASASAGALEPMIDPSILADRTKAFEMFRRNYRKNDVIEENKSILKRKYSEAKQVGESVNASRQRITALKAQLEQSRVARAVRAAAEGVPEGADEVPPEELKMKSEMDAEKASYKANFNTLRDLKHEIEHLQMLLEQSGNRLQSDFEQWLGVMIRQQQQHVQTQQLLQPASRPASQSGLANAAFSAREMAGDISATGSPVGAPGSPAGSPALAQASPRYPATSMGPPRAVRQAWGTSEPASPSGAAMPGNPAPMVPQRPGSSSGMDGGQGIGAASAAAAYRYANGAVHGAPPGGAAAGRYAGSSDAMYSGGSMPGSPLAGRPGSGSYAGSPMAGGGASGGMMGGGAYGSNGGARQVPVTGTVSRVLPSEGSQGSGLGVRMSAEQRAGPVLTGNPEADADILAFYKAKERLLSSRMNKQ
eukprot:jgi/Mesvir1/16506/Mv10060-RA.1